MMRLYWVLEENKHKYDTRYKQGDIQLVSSLIAACQTNYARRQESEKIEPKTLYGIEVLGEEIYFYRIDFCENYINEISTDLPQAQLHVLKYPEKRGLRLSHPKERKIILYMMYRLREYALSLPSPSPDIIYSTSTSGAEG